LKYGVSKSPAKSRAFPFDEDESWCGERSFDDRSLAFQDRSLKGLNSTQSFKQSQNQSAQTGRFWREKLR